MSIAASVIRLHFANITSMLCSLELRPDYMIASEQEGDCQGAACNDKRGELSCTGQLHAWQRPDGFAYHAAFAAVQH